jgi:hypothetical protein
VQQSARGLARAAADIDVVDQVGDGIGGEDQLRGGAENLREQVEGLRGLPVAGPPAHTCGAPDDASTSSAVNSLCRAPHGQRSRRAGKQKGSDGP